MCTSPPRHCWAEVSIAATVLLWAVACGSGDIVLGTRGGAVGRIGPDASLPNLGGSGGLTPDGGGTMAVDPVQTGVAGSSGRAPDAGADGPMSGASGGAPTANVAGQVASAGTGGTAAVPRTSSGCGKQSPAADTSILVAGMRANYIVDLATGYDSARPYPLIVTFRGPSMTSEAFRDYLGLSSIVGTHAIVVTANPLNDAVTWDYTRDPALFDALLMKLGAQYCIDQDRVFAVGHASGGAFVSSLACMFGDKLRGIGSLAGAPPTGPAGAPAAGPCPGEFGVMLTQGNADMWLTTGRANRSFWLRNNGCNASTSVPVDPSPCVAYAGCGTGAPVQYCEYDGDVDVPPVLVSGVWAFFQGL